MLKVFRHHIALPVSLLAVTEVVLFIVVIFGVQWVGASSFLMTNAPETHSPTLALFLTGVAFLSLAGAGLYNRDVLTDERLFLQRAGVALLLTIFAALFVFPFYGLFDPVTVEWYLGLLSFTLLIHYPLVIVTRFGLFAFTQADIFKKRVLILGEGTLAARLRNFVSEQSNHHLNLAGMIDRKDFSSYLGEDNGAVPENFPAGQSPLLGFALDNNVDEIVIASGERRGLPIWQLLECRMAGVQVTDYMSFWEREAGQIDLEEVRPSWLALSEGFSEDRLRTGVKRTFDVVVSLAILIVTLPVTLLTAVLIKLDSPGPVLYRQERVGRFGTHFRIMKFRSMCEDAEKDGVPKWATQVDHRVTRVGQFIRRTRIDEIPQVLNVLKGEMSFIGPRPERSFFVDSLCADIPLYAARHNVKPGITGWAQVNYPYGASDDDAKKKLAFDLYYVKNGSLFLDVIILLQTVRVVVMLVGSR